MNISYDRSRMNAMTVSRIVSNRKWTAAALIVATIWFGMLLGVSFLATPAKFLAPSLSLPVALDVGRHTFSVFNKGEWLLSVAMIATLLVGDRNWQSMSAMGVVILLVAAETFWLLPLLDHRVGMIIAGHQPPPSNLHNLYIAFELGKLLALAFVALVMARRLAGPSPRFYAEGSEAR